MLSWVLWAVLANYQIQGGVMGNQQTVDQKYAILK